MDRIRNANFDWQIGLIGVSAIIGLSLAYNAAAALILFALIVTGIAMYFLVANLPDPVVRRGSVRSPLSGLLILLTTVIAMYFLLTNDWPRWIGKISVLDPILRALARSPLSSVGLELNPNVVGGALAALLPLQVYALRRAQVRPWISIIAIAPSVLALLLTQARGAWLSLALVVVAWMSWRFIEARSADRRRSRMIWLAIVAVASTTAIALLTLTPLGDRLLDLGGDRRNIWENTVDLIGDYPLTGLGLAGFEMAYSTYSLLTHVGHTLHAHNLWLDIWLNQGMLGVVALAGMVLNAVWPKPSSNWRMPALLTLGVILLHSLVDDPYYGYGGAGLPLLFIPLGLLARPPEQSANGTAMQQSKFQPAFGVWGAVTGLLVAVVITPQGRALIESNAGALNQTQAELSVYRWPEIPIQDALRRPGSIDLTGTIQHYEAALAIDPANVTANRRLGQIELARGMYDAACQRLSAAFAANPNQRATRQLVGECAVFSGGSEQAVALWRSIDMSAGQLMARQWWYESYLAAHDKAQQLKQAADAWSMRVLLDSDSSPAD